MCFIIENKQLLMARHSAYAHKKFQNCILLQGLEVS